MGSIPDPPAHHGPNVHDPSHGNQQPWAVIFCPGHDHRSEWRRTLLHCAESGYQVVALAVGERAWPSALAMVEAGDADRIVTTARSGHTTGPGVEVAGAGRTVLRTPSRVSRLRQIAELIDSPLSIEQIVRRLRSQPDVGEPPAGPERRPSRRPGRPGEGRQEWT